MGATAGSAEGKRGPADRLAIAVGAVVHEVGYDVDCDEDLRRSVTERSGQELVESDHVDVVDVVLLWWREDDGDLVDALVDALGPLAANGVIWLITPKAGRAGHVEASDISEAAQTAGLNQTTTVSAARDWSGARLVTRGARR